MELIPAAKLMLLRICENKPVEVTKFSDSVEQLFELELAYIQSPNLLKPTEKGIHYHEQMARARS